MHNDNPLFPSQNDAAVPSGYILPKQQPSLSPLPKQTHDANPAVDLIRQKLTKIYAQEPDPLAEAEEVQSLKPRTKHQQFMYELSTSGKSLATIQTEWHQYYANLSDQEKHEVWQEFYESYDKSHQKVSLKKDRGNRSTVISPTKSTPNINHPTITAMTLEPGLAISDNRSTTQIKRLIRDKVTAGGKLKLKHHLQSLGFGMAIGFVVLVIFMFSFFNEVLIAPFIQPGSVSATPIIVDPSSVAPSSTPTVIIPKINVDIPIDFSVTSTNENVIENDLEAGVVHYPTTVLPGQNGNSAYFGHSSNNIFNPGKYKFAFVLLHTLVPGDTFYITYGGKVYIYKVFEKQIVSPNDIAVLDNIPGHTATATLITCDPPGTSINRLIVVGDQISPSPATNSSGQNTSLALPQSTQLPSNGPSLLSRLWNTLF